MKCDKVTVGMQLSVGRKKDAPKFRVVEMCGDQVKLAYIDQHGQRKEFWTGVEPYNKAPSGK